MQAKTAAQQAPSAKRKKAELGKKILLTRPTF
jgi:hypothetical protein